MTITLITATIVAPSVFWLGYFYYKDRFKPEPAWAVAAAYLMGFGAAYICFHSYSLLPLIGLPSDASVIMDNDRWLFLFYCLGPVGMLEEVMKFMPFLLIIFTFKVFDEKIDGIIYASVIALGFATFENLHYLTYLDGFALFGRAIASPLTHTIYSSIWGYIIGVAHLEGKSRMKAAAIGLLLASLLHGLFDFLTTSPTLRLLSAFLILGVWVWRIRLTEKLYRLENSNQNT